MKLRSLVSLVGLTVTLGMAQVSWAETPTNTIKTLLDAVRSYDKAASAAANANAQKIVEGTLPIQDLSKEVLGPQWEKLNATEQKNFVQLLRDLLHKVA